jgi:hypothetical protein
MHDCPGSLLSGKAGRVRDFLLYIAIAVAITASVVIHGFRQSKAGGSADLPMKWIGFAGMTAIVFGYCLKACRAKWRMPRLWLFLILFFAAHSIAGILVLAKTPVMPLVWFAIFTGPEYLFLVKYLDYFVFPETPLK